MNSLSQVQTLPEAERPEAKSAFFNAHHSPVGAFASFTLGSKGASGGFGFELGGPANEDVYIGVESAAAAGQYVALPFFGSGDVGATAQEYDVDSLSGITRARGMTTFADAEIARRLDAGADVWSAGDLRFAVYSPVKPVPDPATAAEDQMRFALAPIVLAELTVDNRKGVAPRKAFFGYCGSDRLHAMRAWNDGGLTCVGQGRIAIATFDPDVYAGVAFQPEAILEPAHSENLQFMLGRVGLLVGTVAAGEVRTFRFVIGFFEEGLVTQGLPGRYLYRRYFENLADALRFGLDHFARFASAAESMNEALTGGLPPERAFMLAHAIRSYYGSTQCLELEGGRPLWVVNEGEYRMMNTLDLMADQSFFELRMNLWTVRSELEFHLQRYAYKDSYGLAFTHDVGVANAFAPPGRSSYELAGLSGCFSYMSCEELVNWTLCACLCGLVDKDQDWMRSMSDALGECLESLVCRDAADSDSRDGVMSLDSDRCRGGAEITTYDSLDTSLGQARENLYLAVKTWAAYVLLARTFEALQDEDRAALAHHQAELVAATVASTAGVDGVLPAILGVAHPAKIIPAIEGLAFLRFAGVFEELDSEGRFGNLIRALGRHLEAVLREGVCLFPDGGWKLSSTSGNSWLSKIYLCQYVAERVFGLPRDARADQAHVAWLMDPNNGYFAWSDQMLEGRAVGSRYYPRGVTAFLWIDEKEVDI